MDYKKIILLVVLFNCTLLLRAQDANGTDLYKENYDLKKELKEKDDKIKELEERLAQMTLERNRVDSLLKEEKAVGKSSEVKAHIRKLEKEIKELEAKLQDCAANAETAVNQQTQANQEQILRLRQQHSQDSIEIASLKSELSDLSDFRKMWLAQLAESVNEKWLDKPYSKIDVNELQKALAQYEEFASTDQRIADASVKLKELLAACQLYEQGVKVVSSPYDASQISAIAAKIKNLRDNTADSEKKKELSSLFWQLDNYGVTVEIFQDIIKAVDEQISGQDRHKAAWPLVNAVMEKLEKEDEYITAVKKIPWLSEQYGLYYDALKKDCIAPNPVHDIIMNIHP